MLMSIATLPLGIDHGTSNARPMRSAARAAPSSILFHQDPELVAAEACGGVVGAQDVPEVVGDGDENLVAGLVSERVVDILEAVEIQIQHRHGRAAATRTRDRDLHLLHEQGPVREAR